MNRSSSNPRSAATWPYPPSAYDDQWCLKPSWVTIAVWLFSVRHLLLVLILYFPIMPGRTQMGFLQNALSVPLTLAEVPALLLVIAWRYRRADAPSFWRPIWHHGRTLLLTTLIAQAVLIGTDLWNGVTEGELEGVTLFQLPVQVAAVWYSLTARRLKDLLADYPSPPAASEPRLLEPRAKAPDPPASAAASNVQDRPDSREPPPAVVRALSLIAHSRAMQDGLNLPHLEKRLARGAHASAPLWSALSARAAAKGALDEARCFIEAAIALVPENAAYRASLCEIHRRSGQLDKAILAGRLALQRDKGLTVAHYNLALALADAGQSEAAIARYRAAVRLQPDHGRAWNNLGVLYWQRAQIDSARAAFARALAAAPELVEARRNLEQTAGR